MFHPPVFMGQLDNAGTEAGMLLYWVDSNGRRNVSRVRSYDGSKEGSSV